MAGEPDGEARVGWLAAVAEAAFGVGVFVFREEPEADGDLRAGEERARKGDHAVHEVGLNEDAAELVSFRMGRSSAWRFRESSGQIFLRSHKSVPC